MPGPLQNADGEKTRRRHRSKRKIFVKLKVYLRQRLEQLKGVVMCVFLMLSDLADIFQTQGLEQACFAQIKVQVREAG